MVMKSKDIMKQELLQKFGAAFQSENKEDLVTAFVDFASEIQQNVLDDAKAYQQSGDTLILQKRGVHQLTSKEKEFYQKWIDAAKSGNPKQTLTNLDIALPETIIDNVMVDMKAAHPLLDMIDFVSATLLTKILVNKQGKQLAVWGKISSAITGELEGTIGKIDLTLNKLTAFMPIDKDMLAIGPQWVDAYIRAVLSEAVAYALEEAIINGTGKDMPIGMNRQVGDDVTVTGGVYPKKETITVTSLDAVTYGSLISEIAKDSVEPTKARNVSELVIIVNPFDYFRKVMPATTYLTPQGTYVNNVLPYPTKIIASAQMEEGKSILGMAKQYKMGLGTGSSKDGKIEYSDEYKFLEDQRYYITKLIANGRAMFDNDFLVLDITQLKPASLKVDNKVDVLKEIKITSAAGTKEGDTKITTTNSLESGSSYRYKVGDNVTVPVVNQLVFNWTAWDGTSDITAATGKTIVIAEVNGIGQVKGAGSTTVTSK